MATSSNTEGLANQMPTGGSGEFMPKGPRNEPLATSGHQPGKRVGNDAAPEFSAETLPAGSAPADRTFQPNPTSEAPPIASSSEQADSESEQANASDTITGATSGDVHTGLGHPGSGQTSAELRRDVHSEGSLEGRGATTEEFKTADPHDPQFKHLRALDKDEAEVGRGTVGGAAAEETIPKTAETVASESRS